MKYSKYNYQYKFKNHHVLYNTLYGSILEIPEMNLQDIKHLNKKEIEIFKRNRFIIPDNLDEINLIRSQNKIQRFNEQTLELTILPTRWCNLNCSYCFEDRKNINMTEEDIEAIYNLIKNKIHKINCVSLLWFGGEPLLQIDKIKNLSSRVKKIAESKKVKFKNSIITNGVLLTANNQKKLLDSDIKYMQITLDGPPKIHDKRKPTLDGRGTFENIFENIKRVSDIFELSVRINIDKNNKLYITELIDILAESKLQDKIYIYIAKVESGTGACSNISGTCLRDSDFLNSEKKTLDYLKKKGFSKLAIPSYRLNYCTADNIHSYTIPPERKIHKCWHMVDNDKEVAGELLLDGKIKFNNNVFKWFAYDPLDSERCRECKILPLCMGGCPKTRIIDKKKSCDKLRNIINKYLEKQVLENLK